MIITERIDKEQRDFEKILNKAHLIINGESQKNPSLFYNKNANQFEFDVYEAMCEASKKSVFDKTIELISGHKFPDIIAKKFYGVEVKTTKQDHWRSTGNSVLETTRVDNIERIYLFFGKFTDPIGFKIRKYEDCLYDVAVTHSPRYLIDMDLENGKSIFDKLNLPYDELRKLNNPIKPIIKYYRGICKDGEEPWWMDSGESADNVIRPIVTLWSHLDIETQKDLRNEAMARFPEIFSRSSTKYQRLASWLAARHGIVDSSLRDRFTAGGQVNLKINRKTYKSLPRIFKYLQENIEEVIEKVRTISIDDAVYHWKLNTNPIYNDLVNIWIEKIIEFSSDSLKNSRVFIIHLLSDSLGENHTSSLLREESSKYGL